MYIVAILACSTGLEKQTSFTQIKWTIISNLIETNLISISLFSFFFCSSYLFLGVCLLLVFFLVFSSLNWLIRHSSSTHNISLTSGVLLVLITYYFWNGTIPTLMFKYEKQKCTKIHRMNTKTVQHQQHQQHTQKNGGKKSTITWPKWNDKLQPKRLFRNGSNK